MKTMGQRIREERIKHHLTQAELGKMIGVSRQAISQWEQGKIKFIDRFKVNQLAEYFHCDPSWLMDMKDAGRVTVTYEAEGKEPVKMRVSNEHDHPIIGTSALKVKLYKAALQVPPENYEIAIELLESLIK